MSKKLPRARRKELREKGVLETPSRTVEEARRERRAEEDASAPRETALRERVAAEETRDEPAAPAMKPKKRRDLTPLVLAGLVALAGLILWLTQRPQRKDTKADAPAATATTTVKR